MRRKDNFTRSRAASTFLASVVVLSTLAVLGASRALAQPAPAGPGVSPPVPPTPSSDPAASGSAVPVPSDSSSSPAPSASPSALPAGPPPAPPTPPVTPTPQVGAPSPAPASPPPKKEDVQPRYPNHSPFTVNPYIDAGISVGAMVLIGMPRLLQNETVRPWCGLNCKKSDVNPLDRTVIGFESKLALNVSNGGFGLSCATPFVVGFIDMLTSKPSDGFLGYSKDALVMLETLSITLTTNNLLSYVVRRPRPHVYNTDLSDADRLKPDNSFSFPSGHTSASFAMATAYSRIYMLRHPKSPAVVPVWVGSYSLAVATGVLRPLAGDHFWTDVMVGGVTGIGLGLLVPWLHMTESNRAHNTAYDPRPDHVSLHVMPLPLDRGGGLSLSLD